MIISFQLYNFAATFPVDFTFEGTRKFLLWHMAALTLSFLACVAGVISAGLRDADWLAENVPADSVLNDYDVQGRWEQFSHEFRRWRFSTFFVQIPKKCDKSYNLLRLVAR